MDYAIFTKQTLFVTFVDFSKAYGKVPRQVMFDWLKHLGAGNVILQALWGLYRDTRMILGSAIINATVGVRQGSPSSSFLFTTYVDHLVRRLKESCAPDSFLVDLDDTRRFLSGIRYAS